ncbi:MAG: aminotransferase class V-fold PLP-dependent enzyme [Rhodospirillales bacterium]|nr:aminotransferase class V-fold PLP-dependent enzyme [Rhodospirillales bacterium]
MRNANVYERLGARTVVNAKGPVTRLSGGLLDPEVADAMVEASRHCVNMTDLHARASEIIAETTGAESGVVTAGAAAGLMVGAAACIAGLDPAKMERLPDTAGLKNEIIVAQSHRNFYDRLVRAAGARIVQAGISDRLAGTGVRDPEPWEIDAAITDATAAVLYLAMPGQRPPLADVVKVAHARGVPVLVDAASQLPPAGNLKRFIAEGADLVAFSGGKAIGGPQASGILAGRRDLIASAALQMLDNDVLFENFDPPARFIDKSKLRGLPRNGVGRGCKVGKEEIVGLLVALQRFAGGDEEIRRKAWLKTTEAVAAALAGTRHAEIAIVPDSYKPGMPGVRLTLDEKRAGLSGLEFARRLERGEPAVYADVNRAEQGIVTFAPFSLRPDEPAIIGKRVKEILG